MKNDVWKKKKLCKRKKTKIKKAKTVKKTKILGYTGLADNSRLVSPLTRLSNVPIPTAMASYLTRVTGGGEERGGKKEESLDSSLFFLLSFPPSALPSGPHPPEQHKK